MLIDIFSSQSDSSLPSSALSLPPNAAIRKTAAFQRISGNIEAEKSTNAPSSSQQGSGSHPPCPAKGFHIVSAYRNRFACLNGASNTMQPSAASSSGTAQGAQCVRGSLVRAASSPSAKPGLDSVLGANEAKVIHKANKIIQYVTRLALDCY